MKRIKDLALVKTLLEKRNLTEYFDDTAMRAMYAQSHAAGDFVLHEAETAGEILMLISGTALVTSMSDSGEDMIICLQRGFEVFGDLEFLLGRKCFQNSVIAKTDCDFVGFSADAAERLRDDPAFLRLLSLGLAEKLAETGKHYADLALYPLKKRFADFIDGIRDDPSVLNNLATGDIARLLGATDRQLRRVLADAEREGLISRGPPVAILAPPSRPGGKELP